MALKSTTSGARKVAKSDGLRKWSAAIKVKSGSTAERMVHMVVNPVKEVCLTQPADQQWRNSKVPKVKPKLTKNFIKEGELGRLKTNDHHWG